MKQLLRFRWLRQTSLMIATLGLMVLGAERMSAQVISYPTPAEDLNRGYGSGTLTVKVAFAATCASATTVKVGFPTGVTYVAGTVTGTAGTLGITEGDVSNLSAPVFNLIGSISAGTEITFTLEREAGCGTLLEGKDTITVSGCATVTEGAATTNQYNIFAPALTQTAPAAITGAVLGDTATRTITVTNGGASSAVDTLFYYIVYPAGAVTNSTGTNTITANGVAFTPTSTSGDTLFYKIYGATLFGGDNVLNNTEVVTITEPIEVTGCASTTTYGAGWGVDADEQCLVAEVTGAITMATGVPKVTYVSTEVVQHTNMCDDWIGNITYKNTGNETVAGAGMAYNVNPLFGMNAFGSSLVFNAQTGTITDVSINGTSVSFCTGAGCEAGMSATIDLTTDPDGPGGLQDADGDGFYDDLAVGDSFTYQLTIQYNCQTACPSNHSTGAARYSADYDNQCGIAQSRIVIINEPPHATNAPLGDMSIVAPSDINDGDTFSYQVCFSRKEAMNSTFYECTSDTLLLQIKLPAGFTPVLGTALYNNIATGFFMTGDTLNVVGNTNTLVLANGACYSVDLTLDCSAYTGSPDFPTQLRYVCESSCSCQELWGCKDFSALVHCPSPCPEGGLTTKKTFITRTTYGYADSTGTTRADVADIPAQSLKQVMPCDSVIITALGVQIDGTSGGASHTWDNGHFRISYDQLGGTLDLFNYVGGTVEFYDASSGTTTPCALPTPTISYAGGKHIADYDLSSCIASTTLAPGDSMNMYIKAVVLQNNNLTVGALAPVPGFVLQHYNVVAGTEYYCDIYSAELYAHRYDPTVRSGMGVQNVLGCDYFSGLANLWGRNTVYDLYPNEYRTAQIIDSIVVITGVTNALLDLTYNNHYRTRNQDGSQNIISLGAPTYYTSTGFTWVNPGTWTYSDEVTESGANGVYMRMLPNCNSENGTFRVQLYARSNAYAYDPSCMINFTTSTPSNISFVLPDMEVQNLTGEVQGVLPSHHWDIRLRNPSTQTAHYVWLALEQAATSGIVVDSVALMPSGTILTPTSTYGSGNTWYEINATGMATGTNQDARVYFHYTSCTADSIVAKTGWSCTEFPSPDPSAYACEADSVVLKVIPQPSQVQLSVVRQPGDGGPINLCEADSTVLLFNSALGANVIDPKVTFTPPAGVTITSVNVEYPVGSGTIEALPTTDLGGLLLVDLTDHSNYDAEGVPGVLTADPAYSPAGGDRQAKLTFNFTTDCDYISGSKMRFQVYGTRPCGATATGNAGRVSTSPLNINGASTTGTAALNINMGTDPVLSCGSTFTVNASAVPVSSPSVAGDTVTYYIPPGINYLGNFTTTSGATAITEAGPGGLTILKVAMPVVPSGVTIAYTFDVEAAGEGCAQTLIEGEYKRSIAPLVCGGTPCPSSSIILAYGESDTITLSKPDLYITSASTTTSPLMVGDVETYNVTIENRSSTATAAASTYIVEVFCGTNATPYHTEILAPSIAPGAMVTVAIDATAIAPCVDGDSVTIKIQAITAASDTQCLCTPTARTLGEVLPVEFSYINAQSAGNCDVTVKFGTLTEHENDYFVVEHSTDGRTWNDIATIESLSASGHSAPWNYEYTHTDATKGLNLYQVRQVDIDGNYGYSKAVDVIVDCDNQASSIRPNPASNTAFISGAPAGSKVKVYNNLAQLMNVTVDYDGKEYILDLRSLASGVYYVTVELKDGTTETHKLTVKH